MFGYVRVRRADLLVKDDEYYSALYCGLCRSMGKRTGQRSRMALSYDFVFMAAVRMAVSGERPTFAKRRCPAHPLKNKTFVVAGPEMQYCADCAGLLTGLKCRDDCHDEHGVRRAAAGMARVWFGGTRRSVKRYPELYAALEALTARLAEMETDGSATVDAHADLCGQMLRLLFENGLEGSAARLCGNIGYHVGKLVDMLDALDDWEKDRAADRFNPLRVVYPDAGDADRDTIFEHVKVGMQGEILALQQAVDLIDFDGRQDLERIVQNVVQRGMPDAVVRVTAPKK